MLKTLSKLEAGHYIDEQSARLARQAEENGVPNHTIGYEIELHDDAAPSVPMLEIVHDPEVDYDATESAINCKQTLANLGYEIGVDGIYEIVSPAARSPIALDVATRGITRAGVLPIELDKGAPAHISIGMPNKSGGLTIVQRRIRATNMLRAIELCGGSTEYRLVGDPENGYFAHRGWSSRGEVGVDIPDDKLLQEKENFWQGNSSRIEFRSLSYQNPDQFGNTLEAIYFMSRAMLETETGAAEIYDQFEAWLIDYQRENGLKTMNASLLLNFSLSSKQNKQTFWDAYMTSHAAHLATADSSEVSQKVADTVDELKQAFDMPDADLDELMAA